jgi:hypothetical protein
VKKLPALAALNYAIVRERFPAVWALLKDAESPPVEPVQVGGVVRTFRVHGIQYTSAIDPLREARVQAETIPEDAENACIYGVGLGDLPRVLLDRSALKKMAVFVLNSELFKAVLERVDCRAWLSDPRVYLAHASAMTTTIFGPLSVSPIDVKFPDDSAVQVRDRLRAYLNCKFNDFAVSSRRDEDVARVKENEPFLLTDKPIKELFGTRKGCSAIVCAGGPTLGNYYQWIKERRESHLLIAVSASLLPLQNAGITPDAAVALDQHRDQARYFEGYESSGIALAYDPLVTDEVLRGWRGPRYHYLNLDDGLWTNGTVSHAAVDLAVKMGAVEVFLLGFDFSYPGDKSHVEGRAKADDIAFYGQLYTVNGHGQRVSSANNLCQYRAGTEDLIKRHSDVKFWKLGRDGVPLHGAEWLDERRVA